jgi:hypothetical protein
LGSGPHDADSCARRFRITAFACATRLGESGKTAGDEVPFGGGEIEFCAPFPFAGPVVKNAHGFDFDEFSN